MGRSGRAAVARSAARARSRTCSARWTWCCRCCTARSARTARSRACWRWPASVTSGAGVLASAVSMDKEYMKIDLPGPRPAGGAARGGPRAGLAAVRTRTAASRGRPGAGPGAQAGAGRDRRTRLAAVRQAGPGRVEHRHVQGPDMAGLQAAIENARSYDPKVLVEAAIEGMRDRVRGARGRGRRPAGRQRPGLAADRRRRGVLRLRGEVPGRGQRDGDPGADPRRAPAGDPPDGRGGVRGGLRARAWPGWTSSTPRTARS